MAIKICLDAGHYGKINRSPVVKEYYESEMTWKLHLLLKKYLEQYGFEVITTRSEQEKDKELLDRGQTALGCDLFLSLHSNACDTESVDRPVVIVPYNGMADAIGKVLGKCIQDTMNVSNYQLLKKKSEKGDWDWYTVIQGAVSVGVPGIILEHSFHTNTKATKWLLDESNLEKLAKAEASVIASYYGVKTTPEVTTKEYAKSFDKSLAGTYEVTAGLGLNIRHGAGIMKKWMVTLPKGTKVQCYGYYTKVLWVKWLTVQFTYKGVKYTGFASSKYLKKL